MRIMGSYLDRDYRSLRMDYGTRVVIEVSSAWTEGYSGREDDVDFYISVRSGCYIFHIMSNKGEYISKKMADELIESIAISDVTILDNYNMAFFDAIDTTPDE